MEGEKVCNKYLDENYEHYVVEYRGEFDLLRLIMLVEQL